MIDIVHRVGIKAPISKVYGAVSTVEGVAGWWTEDAVGTSKLGGSAQLRFRALSGEELGNVTFEFIALEPNKEVRWRITSGPKEWIGTDVTFTLSEDRGYTVLLFGHRNWREAVEFTAHCSMKWATFLLSLRALLETGTGRSAPNDLKIDNWN